MFWRAIQKYGWDAFQHTIIADGLTKEEAEQMEMEYIKKWRTQEKKFGYNIKEGGSTARLTPEIKEKISVTHLGALNPMFGRNHTEEEKSHLRDMMTGKGNPRYGVKLSDEIKERISKSLRGKPLSEETKRKLSEACKGKLKGRPRPAGSGRPPIQVLCVETNTVYPSINEAARDTNTNKANIRACLRGDAKTTGGYHWQKYLPSAS